MAWPGSVFSAAGLATARSSASTRLAAHRGMLYAATSHSSADCWPRCGPTMDRHGSVQPAAAWCRTTRRTPSTRREHWPSPNDMLYLGTSEAHVGASDHRARGVGHVRRICLNADANAIANGQRRGDQDGNAIRRGQRQQRQPPQRQQPPARLRHRRRRPQRPRQPPRLAAPASSCPLSPSRQRQRGVNHA